MTTKLTKRGSLYICVSSWFYYLSFIIIQLSHSHYISLPTKFCQHFVSKLTKIPQIFYHYFVFGFLILQASLQITTWHFVLNKVSEGFFCWVTKCFVFCLSCMASFAVPPREANWTPIDPHCPLGYWNRPLV